MGFRNLLFALLLSGELANAQKRDFTYQYIQYGLPSGTFADGGPYGYFSPAFIQKHHIDSVCIQSLRCSGGKITGVGGIKTLAKYDTSAYPVQRTVYVNGRMQFTYRLQRLQLSGVGWEWRRETWNKHYKLEQASIHHYDSIHRVDSSWIKPSATKPYHLSYVGIKNSRSRYLNTTFYSAKGLLSKTTYTYDEAGERLLTTASYNQKNKLTRFIDYRCLPQTDTLKVKTTAVCERTDKDPMGNIIEIKEQRFGRHTYLTKYKYGPDKKMLLEVIFQVDQSENVTKVVYTYDDEKRISEVTWYKGEKLNPYQNSRYYYLNGLPIRYEFYRKGKLRQANTYTFIQRKS